MDDELRFALHLADVADELAMRWYRRDPAVRVKPDRTPVTEADTAIETALRREIELRFPEHGVLGEEAGETRPEASSRWILDPVDGTAAFLRGVPNFATLIALEREGRIVLGVASAPAMGHRWWGGAELGAFEDGRAIRVSEVSALEDAHLCHGELRGFRRHGLEAGFAELWPRTWRQSGLGDFYGHVLVASGCAELMPEPLVAPWDVAAVLAIVEGAGGRCTDLSGRVDVRAGSCLSSNGLLHDQVLQLLAPGRR